MRPKGFHSRIEKIVEKAQQNKNKSMENNKMSSM